MVETPAVLAAVAGIAEEVSKAWQAWAALLGFMAHGGEVRLCRLKTSTGLVEEAHGGGDS